MERLDCHVAVIGMSGVFPEAPSLDVFYQNLKTGRDSVRKVSDERLIDSNLDPNKEYQPIGFLNRIDAFDYSFFGLSKKDAEYMDPVQRLSLQLACQAIENAGYSLKDFDGSRTAVFLGGSHSEYYHLLENPSDPAILTGNLSSMTAGRIAYFLNLTGPAMMVDTACSSSLVALHEASMKVLHEEVEYALAGGIGIILGFPEKATGLGSSTGIASPDGKSKTFDIDASGTGMGEGGGVVLLKRLDKAIKDRDNIHAVIRGSATNQDGGRSNGITAPSPLAQTDVILRAWKKANVHPKSITYIEAHGTGTKLGDPIEVQAITDAFKTVTDEQHFCALSAVKTNIGHLDNAAGMAGFIKAVLALKNKALFPSLHFKIPNPYINLLDTAIRVNTKFQKWEPHQLPRRCGVSAFGLSGTNAHIILEEAPVLSNDSKVQKASDLFLKISTKTPASLLAYCKNIHDYLLSFSGNIEQALFTLNQGRDDYKFRVAFCGESQADLLEQISSMIEVLEENQDTVQAIPNRSIILLLSDSRYPSNFQEKLAAEHPLCAEIFQSFDYDSVKPEQKELLYHISIQFALVKLLESKGLKYSKIIAGGIGKLVRLLLETSESLEEVANILAGIAQPEPLDEGKLTRAIAALTQSSSPIFLDIGHQSYMGTLLGNEIESSSELALQLSCPNYDQSFSLSSLLKELYNKGCEWDWSSLYTAGKFLKVEAPTYPFEIKRCWAFKQIDPIQAKLEKWFYEIDWQEKSYDGIKTNSVVQHFLVWAPNQKLVEKLKSAEPNNRYTEILLSDKFSQISDSCFEIDIYSEENYQTLFHLFEKKGLKIDGIIHLGALDVPQTIEYTTLENSLQRGIYSQIYMLRAFHSYLSKKNFKLIVASGNGHCVLENESIKPSNSAVSGLLRGVQSDYPFLMVHAIDVDDIGKNPTALANIITQETSYDDPVRFVAYRNEKRYIPILKQLDYSKYTDHHNLLVKKGGIYLITGGATGLGFELCKYILSQVKARFILLGRTSVEEREIAEKRSDSVKERQQNIQLLESMGAEVDYYAVNVADQTGMEKTFAKIYESYSQIDGVIHAAGVGIHNIPLEEKPWQDIEKILHPKIQGLVLLANYLERYKPSFVSCFSSLNAILPQKQSADYAAANAFESAFAAHLYNTGLPYSAVNWPGWERRQKVDQNEESNVIDEKKGNLELISLEEGLKALEFSLNYPNPNLILTKGNINQFTNTPFFAAAALSTSKETSANSLSNSVEEYEYPEKIEDWSELELAVLRIWQKVLNEGQIDKMADFFDIGGHSLNGAQIANRIEKEFNVEVTMATLWEYATIESLAKHIESLRGKPAKESKTDILPLEPAELYEVSHSQKRLWFLSQLKGSSEAYHMVSAMSIQGVLNKQVFEKAFESLWERHESLRTTFISKDNSPWQRIHEVKDLPLEMAYHKLEGSEDVESRTKIILNELAQTPFDLKKGPLMRVALVQWKPDHHVFILVMHHIISDGWSFNVMVKEIASLYQAFDQGKENPLEKLDFHYKDFAHWHNRFLKGPQMEEHKSFWHNSLKGELPVIDIPSDFARPALKSYTGKLLSTSLDSDTTNSLRVLSDKYGCTLFMTILASLNVFLYRYTGQKDIIIGSPVAGRVNVHLENQLGLYLNTLALRSEINEKGSFVNFLQETKKNIISALSHQLYPFDLLVEELQLKRDFSRSPLFDVILNFQAYNAYNQSLEELEKVSFKPYDLEVNVTKFDLGFYVYEGANDIGLIVSYNTDIFSAKRMEGLLKYFENSIKWLLENNNMPLKELDYISTEEREMVMETWNQTEITFDLSQSVTRLFEQQCKNHPDQIGIKFRDQALNYNEINLQSNKIAHYLKEECAIGPGDLVAIIVERSEQMLIQLIGILKSGAAYLPIDPSLPVKRIEYMLQDSQARTILYEKEALKTNISSTLSTNDLAHIRWICFAEEALDSYSTTELTLAYNMRDRMYVMYTSGSTGLPKGVAVSHSSVVNFLCSMQEKPGIKAGERLLAVTTTIFDISVLELFLPLISGAEVIIAPQESIQNPDKLNELIRIEDPDLMQATPSLWKMLLKTNWQGSENLRILCGGEKLAQNLANNLIKCGKELWNMYGPTETTIWSSIQQVSSGNITNSIGRPIGNTLIYIIDEEQKIVPVGNWGEICIGGEGLALGYLNLPDLTADNFVYPAFKPTMRLYKTGDIGRWLPNGEIEYLGRKDKQLKINGYRIEAGEIENILLSIKSISQAVVHYVKTSIGEKELEAFLVLNEPVKVAEIRKRLKEHLPAYMVPLRFFQVDTMPMTPNQKLDRKALKHRPYPLMGGKRPNKSKQTPTEEILGELFGELLSNNAFSYNDNLFEVGLNSMKVISAFKEIEKQFPNTVEIHDIFSNPSIEKLGVFIDGKTPSVQITKKKKLNTIEF